jgi:hypothetical protein
MAAVPSVSKWRRCTDAGDAYDVVDVDGMMAAPTATSSRWEKKNAARSTM